MNQNKPDWKTFCEIQIDASSERAVFQFKSVIPKNELIDLLKNLIGEQDKICTGRLKIRSA